MFVVEISLFCPFLRIFVIYVCRGDFPALSILEDFSCMSVEEISMLCPFLLYDSRGDFPALSVSMGFAVCQSGRFPCSVRTCGF